MSNGFISAGKTNSGVDRLHERSQKGAVSTEEKEVALELREATSVIRTLISQAINEGEAALDQNYPTLSGGRWTLWHNKEAHFLQAIKDIRLKPAVSIKISRAKLAPHPSFPAHPLLSDTLFDRAWNAISPPYGYKGLASWNERRRRAARRPRWRPGRRD